MKQILQSFLALIWLTLVFTACSTSNHSIVETKLHNVERQNEARADSVSEHSADTVFVVVEKDDSIIRITERKIHWREKLKVQRDTVRVYIQNDTINKMLSVMKQTQRSPPRCKQSLALLLTMIALVAIAVLTIKKSFKL